MLFLVLGVLATFIIAVAAIVVLSRRRGVEVVSLTSPPGIPSPMTPEQLVRAGKKIEAIKRYRELTGLGLRAAKEAVDALERGGTATLPPKSSLLRQVNDSEIEAQIRRGHLIDAIKLYREKTGVGLKEAKDAVEAWRHRMSAS